MPAEAPAEVPAEVPVGVVVALEAAGIAELAGIVEVPEVGVEVGVEVAEEVVGVSGTDWAAHRCACSGNGCVPGLEQTLPQRKIWKEN